MKRLAFLFMLIPGLAFAQVGPEVYKPATGAQVLPFNNTDVFTITNALADSRMSRVVCSAACYVSITASGTTATISNIYLPADVPMIFSISKNSKISVIGFGGSGTANILELTK